MVRTLSSGTFDQAIHELRLEHISALLVNANGES